MEANIKSLDDTTVGVEPSEALKDFVASQDELSRVQSSLEQNQRLTSLDLKEIADLIHGDSTADTISGEELDSVLEEFIANTKKLTVQPEGPSLHKLLENSKIELPKNPVVERNPVLAARVEKLRRQQDEQAYQAMTKGISPGKFHKEDTVAFQMRMMNRQLIAVGQVVISVAAGFAFGFIGIPLLVGGMEFGVRILLGLFFAGIIAVAELYFLAKHMHAEDAQTDQNVSTNSDPSLPTHLHVD